MMTKPTLGAKVLGKMKPTTQVLKRILSRNYPIASQSDKLAKKNKETKTNVQKGHLSALYNTISKMRCGVYRIGLLSESMRRLSVFELKHHRN